MLLTAILAGIAMVIQDVLGTLLTQAEARNRAALAGLFDTLGWPAAIWCTAITVTAMQSHNYANIALVIVVVSLANFFGSYFAVRLGKRLVKVDAPKVREKKLRYPTKSDTLISRQETTIWGYFFMY